MPERITVSDIDRDEAFRYMAAEGYTPEGTLADITEECEKRLLAAVRPVYTYRVLPIESIDDSGVVLPGIIFPGKDITELLAGCTHAVLMCATVGAAVDALIRRMQSEDMAKAVVTDALASAAIEQVCNKFDILLAEKYPDRYFTFRFSPGYGDLPLTMQHELLSVLNASRLAGITLDSSGLMLPMKSVSAVCGMSVSPLERKKTGCAFCRMKDNCSFRRKGVRCGF